MILLVAVVALALLATMVCAWLTQRATGNVGWLDVYWTLGTGAAAVILSLWPLPGAPSGRQWLVSALAAVWSLRLGLYVAFRVAGSADEDRRYSDLRKDWGEAFQRKLLPFALIQAPVGLFLAWTIMLAARAPGAGLRPADVLGLAILLVAILGEALADEQLRVFKADPANRGRICDLGLWAWSRHPNYFFEWFGWLAYPVIASILDGSYGLGWFAWGAPILMYLILDRGTGVPPLEAQMLKSRGQAFVAYQARTSRFFPSPPRKLT